jgi:hypothetical protein
MWQLSIRSKIILVLLLTGLACLAAGAIIGYRAGDAALRQSVETGTAPNVRLGVRLSSDALRPDKLEAYPTCAPAPSRFRIGSTIDQIVETRTTRRRIVRFSFRPRQQIDPLAFLYLADLSGLMRPGHGIGTNKCSSNH